MNIQSNQFLSIEQLQAQYLTQTKKATQVQTADGFSFQEILNQQAGASDELKFSKHAVDRLADRNITLSDNQIERLQEGTVKASEKGIKESLVIVDQMAFIVNVPNNTVITAMNHRDTDNKIYTNIDGAVII